VLDQNTRTERLAGRKELLKIGTILLRERKRLEERHGKRDECGAKCYRKNGRRAPSTPDRMRHEVRPHERHRRRPRCG